MYIEHVRYVIYNSKLGDNHIKSNLIMKFDYKIKLRSYFFMLIMTRRMRIMLRKV